jgi:hypothetical protein
MKPPDIARRRLLAQRIAGPKFPTPADAVNWLGAVQAQDFAGAKWALGMRSQDATDEAVERAFNKGEFLRTHVLRPTWHFVMPEDIRWMLELTGPRVQALGATYYRKLELDKPLFKRAHAALKKALRGGQALTRDELRAVVERAGITPTDSFRMSFIAMHAELEGIICSGPRRGKQFTYMLLDERAPNAARLDRDAALAELARRFIQSRGPATPHDFAKWSGLTIADARRGFEMVRAGFEREVIEGQAYWFPPALPPARDVSPSAYLLSIYDEYISGYKDRSAMVTPSDGARLIALGNALTHVIVIGGQVAGTWKRTLTAGRVVVSTTPFRRLTRAEKRAVAEAAEPYGAFLQRPVVLVSTHQSSSR